MSQAESGEVLSVASARSGCPINITSEVLGDRWSLVVLRDLMFGQHTRFRDLQHHSLEGIASNVLASRLKKLTEVGLLERRQVAEHRQGVGYALTEPAIQLVPLLIEMGRWGSDWLPASPDLARRARFLADGGSQLRDQLMDELRSIHRNRRPRPDDGVLATLDALSDSAT